MSTRVTILQEWQGSQQRAYGPSVWAGTITFEFDALSKGDFSLWVNAPRESAEQYVRTATNFKDKDEGDWFSPRLVALDVVEPGVWRYRVERSYDD